MKSLSDFKKTLHSIWNPSTGERGRRDNAQEIAEAILSQAERVQLARAVQAMLTKRQNK